MECKSSQSRIPGITSKFDLRVQNEEAGQRLIEFSQKNALVIAHTIFEQHKRRLYTWTSPVVKSEIRLIIFFASKMEKRYTVSKNKTGS